MSSTLANRVLICGTARAMSAGILIMFCVVGMWAWLQQCVCVFRFLCLCNDEFLTDYEFALILRCTVPKSFFCLSLFPLLSPPREYFVFVVCLCSCCEERGPQFAWRCVSDLYLIVVSYEFWYSCYFFHPLDNG